MTSRVTRLAWVGAAAAAAAALVAAGSALPARTPAQHVIALTIGLDLVCPTMEAKAAPTRVAVVPGAAATFQTIGGAAEKSPAAGRVASIGKASGPVRLTVPGGLGAGTSTTAAKSGPERGLAVAPCGAPVTEAWFPGVASSASTLTDLYLTNVDTETADVDLSLFGPTGRIVAPGARSIAVGAGKTVRVALEPLLQMDGLVSVGLQTTHGRVAAVARVHALGAVGAADANGVDWQAPAEAPTTQVVVAGIPAGAGSRQLVVVNPGQAPAEASLRVLAADGSSAPASIATLSIAAETSIVVDVTAELAAGARSLVIDSAVPLTAAVVVTSSGKSTDFAAVPAVAPVTGTVAIPIDSAAADSTLALANPGTASVTVDVGFAGADGTALQPTRSVPVAAGASVAVPVPKGTQTIVQVAVPAGASIGATLTLTQPVGGLAGIATVPLTVRGAAEASSDPVWDARVGR